MPVSPPRQHWPSFYRAILTPVWCINRFSLKLYIGGFHRHKAGLSNWEHSISFSGEMLRASEHFTHRSLHPLSTGACRKHSLESVDDRGLQEADCISWLDLQEMMQEAVHSCVKKKPTAKGERKGIGECDEDQKVSLRNPALNWEWGIGKGHTPPRHA